MDNFRVCRICVSQSESPVMMSIFGKDALWKKITSFANVHIEEGDSLPQQICIVCAKNAIDACLFKQKCEEADSFFRKQLLKRMELRLPDDTEIISISSGSISVDMNGRTASAGGNRSGLGIRAGGCLDGARAMKKVDDDVNHSASIQMHQSHDQDQNDDDDDYDEDNFPILMEDELSNENDQEWDSMNAGQQSSIDDKYDDSLPLIPEIELITPNDDDSQREINEYQCNMCFKSFAMKSVLKHHIKNCHPETNPTYECFECKKTYLSKRFLEKHIRMGRCVKKRKNTTRPMQCSECRTLFPTGHHLGWHKRTGSCRSRSPKLSLTEYEQRNDSETNNEDENGENESNSPMNSGKGKRKKLGKLKQKGGRTRIKLDAKKIAYATELVKQQVSTTKFAQELKISRTFAWRLRKTIENNMYKDGEWDPIRNMNPTITTTTKPMVSTATATATKNPIPNEGVFIKEANDSSNSVLKIDIKSNNDAITIKGQQNKMIEKKLNKQNDKNGGILFERSNGPSSHFQNQIMQASSTATSQEMNKISHKVEIPSSSGKKENNHRKIAKIPEIKKEIDDDESIPNNQEDESEDDGENENESSETDDVDNDIGYSQNESSQPSCSIAFNSTNISSNNKKRQKFDINKHLQANLVYSVRYNKKPRKPNVFITEEKYSQAKILVANNVPTMEIAKKLNISQMSAWKLRDCILKNIPLTFKKQQLPSSSSSSPLSSRMTTTTTTATATIVNKPKIKVPRKRLKRDERVRRDKIITKEILSMIKEDNNIQYWKVSERLAEKGFSLSPSSVCQRLKSMGIHRRLRPNDRGNQFNFDDYSIGDKQQQQQQDSTADDDDNEDNIDMNHSIDLSDHSHFLSTHFNNLA